MMMIKPVRIVVRAIATATLVAVLLSQSGCSGNVGIGMSVGVPIGDHGYISMGTGRYWY